MLFSPLKAKQPALVHLDGVRLQARKWWRLIAGGEVAGHFTESPALSPIPYIQLSDLAGTAARHLLQLGP